MDDRRSHWPIYDVVPLEMIKIVSNTVRKATVEDGIVVYLPKKEMKDNEHKIRRES